MHTRIHDPAAVGLAIVSAATPIAGISAATWHWAGSMAVGVSGIAAAVWIHFSDRAADARRRQDLLDWEHRLSLRSLSLAQEKAPPIGGAQPSAQ
jgi:hypothetical protein